MKTRVMKVARQKGQCEVKVDDEVIEQVDEMKYLGVMISSDGSIEKEVEARIGSAARMVGGMSEAVLRRKELSKKTKLKVINATMLPTLMYGCEAWSLSKQQESKVQATQMRVLSRIEGVSRADRVRNEDLQLRLGQVGIIELTRRRQKKWLKKWRECRMIESQGIFSKERLKGRDLEEDRREDELTRIYLRLHN